MLKVTNKEKMIKKLRRKQSIQNALKRSLSPIDFFYLKNLKVELKTVLLINKP